MVEQVKKDSEGFWLNRESHAGLCDGESVFAYFHVREAEYDVVSINLRPHERITPLSGNDQYSVTTF
jgi:hypothetical protein